jgi:hypothetical protein
MTGLGCRVGRVAIGVLCMLFGTSALTCCAPRSPDPTTLSIKDALPSQAGAATERSKIGTLPAKRAKQASTADPRSCINEDSCSAILRTMVEDPDRAWIWRREPPQSLTKGARLYAYRVLRERLTCAELTLALDELVSVMMQFGGPVADVKAETAAFVVDLAFQAWGELSAERDRRCKDASP